MKTLFIYLFISSRSTLIEAFISAQTPASLKTVLKYLDNSMNSKNKIETIELFLTASAFAPRPLDSLLENILVTNFNIFIFKTNFILFFKERLPKFTSIDSQLEQSTYLALGAIVHRLYDLNKKSPVSKIPLVSIVIH